MEVSENGVLQISYIGYAMTELRPSKEANLNVKLREDALQMDENVAALMGLLYYVTTPKSIFIPCRRAWHR